MRGWTDGNDGNKRHRMPRAAALTVTAGLLAVGLGACSGDRSASLASSTTVAAAEQFAADETMAASDGLAGGVMPADTAGVATAPASTGRMIIRTANLSMHVADVAKAAAAAQSLVIAKGGFVASQQGDYAGVPFLSIVLRVPATAFDTTLTGLRGLGRVTNLSTESNEVTAQVVDLDSRLKTKRASADRLRTLLGSAAKASDLIEIERELSNREAEIESMQGQRNVLGDQVSLSTITVAITATQPSDVRPPAKEKPSFMNGLRGGGRAVVGLARVSAQAAGAVLPFLPLMLVVGALVHVLRKRRAATKSAAPKPMDRSGDPPVEEDVPKTGSAG